MDGPADVIVVGLGAMGSSTADELAGRGLRVIGLEAFAPGHSQGSSHGPTRIIRRVIEEAPFYVPLVLDAFDRWQALEDDTGEELVVRSGVIRIAPGDSDLHQAFRASAAAWGLPYDTLTAAEVNQRFPGFVVPDGFDALFESAAGVVFAGRTVRTLHDRARRRGADLHFEEPVVGWTAAAGGVEVTTKHATYRADRLVITAGAWTAQLAAELGLPLVANRVVNVSFEPIERTLFEADRLPGFIIADDRAGVDGTPALRGDGIYGVPVVPGEGLKVGAGGAPTDPDHVDRTVGVQEIAALREWVERFLPRAAGPVASTLTCLYTKTPDEHFVIGVHPEHDGVVVASPCSGHGFKYTPAIGPLLADLALGVEPAHDLAPFSLTRFAPIV